MSSQRCSIVTFKGTMCCKGCSPAQGCRMIQLDTASVRKSPNHTTSRIQSALQIPHARSLSISHSASRPARLLQLAQWRRRGSGRSGPRFLGGFVVTDCATQSGACHTMVSCYVSDNAADCGTLDASLGECGCRTKRGDQNKYVDHLLHRLRSERSDTCRIEGKLNASDTLRYQALSAWSRCRGG